MGVAIIGCITVDIAEFHSVLVHLVISYTLPCNLLVGGVGLDLRVGSSLFLTSVYFLCFEQLFIVIFMTV